MLQLFLSCVPAVAQILPVAIGGFDERNLFPAQPSLDLFFPRNRCSNVSTNLEVNQTSGVVLGRKPRNQLAFVFRHPPFQVVCDSGI